jgi:hypothetical protein
MPYDTLMYTPDMFENTYEANQHLSNLGMMVTAYKLAACIHENYPDLLPDRSKDIKWINDFKTNEYFAYNQDIANNMAGFSSIVKNKQIGTFYVRELAMQENRENNRLILKINRQDHLPDRLTVQYILTVEGKNFIVPIQMFSPKEIFPPKHKVYIADIQKGIKINDILDITTDLKNQL